VTTRMWGRSCTLGPALGAPITPSTMIARADDWITSDVPYNQGLGWSDAATGGAYREDCSGFVSMAWALNSSLVTWTLPNVSTVIAGNIKGFTGLQPGDALDYIADHVVLFDSWIDRAAGTFYYDAEHQDGVPPSRDVGNINGATLEGYPITDFEALRCGPGDRGRLGAGRQVPGQFRRESRVARIDPVGVPVRLVDQPQADPVALARHERGRLGDQFGADVRRRCRARCRRGGQRRGRTQGASGNDKTTLHDGLRPHRGPENFIERTPGR